MEPHAARGAEALVDRLIAQGWSIATAESLTGGLLSHHLCLAPDSGKVFRGGIVAYTPEVKFDLLGVRRGPVVCAEAAEQMARGARQAIGADVGVSLTGVAGPDDLEGWPVGTVFIGWATPQLAGAEEFRFPGDPEQVCAQAVEAAIGAVLRALPPARLSA